MTTQAMTDPLDLTDDEQSLLNVVPLEGGTIGNQRAQDALAWDDDRYWAARDGLVDKGLVARGRGRGGTIRRVINDVAVGDGAPSEQPQPSKNIVEEVIRREVELYEPMATVLRGDWAKDRRIVGLLSVEIIANQGRRSTGGTWSRPDLVSVETRTFEYVPGKFLEVTTFEVKPTDAIDVQAVYEALAHRRAATRSYVVLHVPAHQLAALEETIKAVSLVARSHGIGVITASDPADYSTWEELEEALRVEPDPERLNEFIETQLSASLKKRIARALR